MLDQGIPLLVRGLGILATPTIEAMVVLLAATWWN